MTEEARRRLGAVAALVAGLFLGLTLLPFPLTGPIGSGVGRLLWKGFGAGAIGVPLLGFELALSGFNRTPRVSMKQAALLLGGLGFLVPYFIGVLTRVTAQAFDPPLEQWSLTARAIGALPGFIATAVYNLVGFAGGLLLGFLALSALTLLTLAWHPLRRLEGPSPGASRRKWPSLRPCRPGRGTSCLLHWKTTRSSSGRRKLTRGEGEETEEAAGPGRREWVGGGDRASVDRSADRPPALGDAVADSAALDRLGQKLIDTLRTFKVEGQHCGPDHAVPWSRSSRWCPAPGVKAGRIAALADDLALAMRAPSIRVAPIPGKGAVGVEVPNPTARMVTLRELLETAGVAAQPRGPPDRAGPGPRRQAGRSPTWPRCRTC